MCKLVKWTWPGGELGAHTPTPKEAAIFSITIMYAGIWAWYGQILLMFHEKPKSGIYYEIFRFSKDSN